MYITYILYRLDLAQGQPTGFRFERDFGASIIQVTDQHLIERETKTGLWVHHRRPACDVSGAGVCADESLSPSCN